ncbi:MAG: amino acid permease [Streptosporangiaceae bacterium]
MARASWPRRLRPSLVIVVAHAGFASPLAVLITFAASLCCAVSIAEFARRVPSAGRAYTYNSRGLGRTADFLTGWMMIFAYALFVPGDIALTSTKPVAQYALTLLVGVLVLAFPRRSSSR